VIGPALEGGLVTLVGEGSQRHSLVAMDDVVGYAVAAVTNDAARNRTIEVGGAEPVSWRDVIATLERVQGRPVEVNTVPIGEPVPGLPAFVVELMTSLEFYESPLDMTEASQTFGVRPTPLEEFVRTLVA
jgi:NADH dehydrogenase